MYKNQIRGIRCRASRQMTTKPISIKGTGCKFPLTPLSCANLAVRPTSSTNIECVKCRLSVTIGLALKEALLI